MKTTYLLFGLATACAANPAKPSYPLCDHAGAPACGNIGQVGRVTPMLAPIAAPTPAPVPRANPAPATTQVLLGGFSEQTSSQPIARPLADDREEYVCANVMTKGGSHRRCHKAGEK